MRRLPATEERVPRRVAHRAPGRRGGHAAVAERPRRRSCWSWPDRVLPRAATGGGPGAGGGHRRRRAPPPGPPTAPPAPLGRSRRVIPLLRQPHPRSRRHGAGRPRAPPPGTRPTGGGGHPGRRRNAGSRKRSGGRRARGDVPGLVRSRGRRCLATPVGAMIHVRVDHGALGRGHTERGEVQVPGAGPVTVGWVESLLADAVVAALEVDDGEVRRSSTWVASFPPGCGPRWWSETGSAWCRAVASSPTSRSTTSVRWPTAAVASWRTCAAFAVFTTTSRPTTGWRVSRQGKRWLWEGPPAHLPTPVPDKPSWRPPAAATPRRWNRRTAGLSDRVGHGRPERPGEPRGGSALSTSRSPHATQPRLSRFARPTQSIHDGTRRGASRVC